MSVQDERLRHTEKQSIEHKSLDAMAADFPLLEGGWPWCQTNCQAVVSNSKKLNEG